jgi:hypothetical protein
MIEISGYAPDILDIKIQDFEQVRRIKSKTGAGKSKKYKNHGEDPASASHAALPLARIDISMSSGKNPATRPGKLSPSPSAVLVYKRRLFEIQAYSTQPR